MPFEAVSKQTPAPAPVPAADVAPARRAPAGGYEAQAAALRPAAQLQQKPAGDPPKFDLWKLSPEVQGLFAQLGRTEDKKEIESIMNTLIGEPHKVPKATVEQVIEANKGFFSKTYGAIKGGSWKTVSTNEQGEVTTVFALDGKGLGWETATFKLDADVKGKSVTYTDKDDDWNVKGSYDDGKATIAGTAGTKEEGLHEYTVTGGKDGGSAAYKHTEGKESKEGKASYTQSDGQHTGHGEYTHTTENGSFHAGGDVYVGKKTGGALVVRETEGKTSREGKASYVHTEGQHTAGGEYIRKTEEGSLHAGGNVHVGKKTGADVVVKTTEGKSSREHKGSVIHQDGQYTGHAERTLKTEEGSQHIGGDVFVGKKDGAAIVVRTTEGDKKSREVKASHIVEDGQHTSHLEGTRKHEKGSESAAVDVFAGPKTGAAGSVTVDRDEWAATVKGDGSVTERGDVTTTTAGGSVVYTDKPGKDAEGKPKEGDTVVIKANGRVTQTDNAASGEGTTKVELGGGVKSGSTEANASYLGLSGAGYRVDQFKADWGKTYDLDAAAKEGLTLKVAGDLRLTDKQGEENTFTGDLTGTWFKGEKEARQELAFRLYGGYENIGKFGNLAHAETSMLGGDKGYGYFGHGAASYAAGGRKYDFDVTYGATEQTQVGGAHFGFQSGEKNKLDLWAAMAKSDAGTSTLLKGTSQFALSKGLTLTSGGEYRMRPGQDGYDELWHIHSGLGIDIRKGMDLTLKMGVASNGEQIYYVPEAMFQFEKKFSLSALAHISQDGRTSVGGKLNIDKANLTIFGGYGDMGALTNPYQGNAGMTMPTMDSRDVMGHGGAQGGYIGVQWNALPTIKKLFGGK